MAYLFWINLNLFFGPVVLCACLAFNIMSFPCTVFLRFSNASFSYFSRAILYRLHLRHTVNYDLTESLMYGSGWVRVKKGTSNLPELLNWYLQYATRCIYVWLNNKKKNFINKMNWINASIIETCLWLL